MLRGRESPRQGEARGLSSGPGGGLTPEEQLQDWGREQGVESLRGPEGPMTKGARWGSHECL